MINVAKEMEHLNKLAGITGKRLTDLGESLTQKNGWPKPGKRYEETREPDAGY